MDRADQAIAMLNENRSKGLNFYQSRQVLLQNGFSDSEIINATDKLDSQSARSQTAQAVTASIPGKMEAVQPNPAPSIPGVNLSTSDIVSIWFVGVRTKGLILLASFAVVFAAGHFYTKHHDAFHLVLYFAALGLSVFTVIYLNVITNIRRAPSKSQQVAAWAVGVVASIICFIFLGYISLLVLS